MAENATNRADFFSERPILISMMMVRLILIAILALLAVAATGLWKILIQVYQ